MVTLADFKYFLFDLPMQWLSMTFNVAGYTISFLQIAFASCLLSLVAYVFSEIIDL